MIINVSRKVIGKIILTAVLSMSVGVNVVEADAQNIFRKLADKVTSLDKNRKKVTKDSNDDKKPKKQKDPVPQLEPTELSLDDNVMWPEVAVKHHEAVKNHMSSVAKRLAKRKTAKIETMRDGEVVVATIGTDILFAPNDTVLLSTGKDQLKPYSQLLAEHPGWYKMLLVVHTDDTGSEEYTDALSEKRVEAVYQMIVDGINDGSYVIPYALGAAEPRLPNTSRANRSANRRLEIFLVPDLKMLELAKSNKLAGG